jgi:hypothetical protein
MIKKVLCPLLFILMLPTISFASINDYSQNTLFRAKCHKVYTQRMKLLDFKYGIPKNDKISLNEKEAIEFLYAYMPLADVTDYTFNFYLKNVRQTLKTRNEMSWGKDVPELLFRHFVLPLRVNNENLDDSRAVFYNELKNRVKGLNMKSAILEVNHWCHEHVVYSPSDGRTLAPLACIKNALGRCGEESTLTVAALRAVGIPARQVYTPRWAHTDDNHAWVEAWADGRWWFFGACEPEPVLNLGWFNAPASRAMLMHTRVFGDYDGPEEVMLRTSNYTEINLIDNYGSSARTDFVVTDNNGKPATDARVDFKIYNYAEFCTVATKYTDNSGKAFLSAGLGDMLVWASQNGFYGYSKVSFGKDKIINIRLDKKSDGNETINDTFDIVPPAEHANIPTVTAEQQAVNGKRLAHEDSLRTAYENTFFKKSDAHLITENGLNADSVISFLINSRGNHDVIFKFLLRHKDNLGRATALLKTLSDKDLRDMPDSILEDNFNAKSNILCPRVEDEMIIHPFKRFFESAFTNNEIKLFRQNPSLLVDWVKQNIRMNPDINALRIAQTPLGVWQSRMTDSRSRTIFFVDLARSLDLNARKDQVTGKTQYMQDGNWIDVDFNSNEQKASPKGHVVLSFTPTKDTDNPKYYSQFTITRINDDGSTTLLSFDEGQVDMGGGVSWKNTFKEGTDIDAGRYVLVTGTRLANGSVLSTMTHFTVAEGKTTTIPLVIRHNDADVTVIGNFDSESKYNLLNGKNVSILSQTGRGYFVIGLIGVGQEPTNHALRDISKEISTFEKWGRPVLLLFSSEDEAKKFNAADFGTLPSTVIYGIDVDGKMREQIAKEMKLENSSLSPIFFISDTFNRVVRLWQGYTIGLGEQMATIIKKIQ